MNKEIIVSEGMEVRLMNGKEVIVSTDAMLNVRLLAKKPLKRDQVMVPYLRISPNGDEEMLRKLSENTLLRFIGYSPVKEPKVFHVVLGNGREKNILVDSQYMQDSNETIAYVSFVKDPGAYCKDEALLAAYERSRDYILNGFGRDGIGYEYLMQSAAQKASAKAVFIRKDYRLPEAYIVQMPKKDQDEYRALCGAEALVSMLSLGAWKSWKKTGGNPSKLMARLGTVLSSSKMIARGARVCIVNSIRMEWSEKIAAMRLEAMTSAGIDPKKAQDLVDAEKAKWKAEKWDGQSIVRASYVHNALSEKGVKIHMEELIGQLLQVRYPIALKGTVLVVDDETMDAVRWPNGEFAYQNFDLIIEGASWKVDFDAAMALGDLQPEFCLLAMSKQKSSNSMHYMLEMALDGTDGDVHTVTSTLKVLADEVFDRFRRMMYDGSVAMAERGVMGWTQHVEDDGLDEMMGRVTSPVLGAIEAYNPAVLDLSVRVKLLSKVFPNVRDLWNGHLPVEGATRFMITDPSAFFRTDLAVPVLDKDGVQKKDMFGNPLWDIVIEDPDDLVLNGTTQCYWDGRMKEALLFRSPCVHPGEPTIVDLVPVEGAMIDLGDDGYLDLTPLFRSMNKLLIVNACSSILEALGGAKSYWLPML